MLEQTVTNNNRLITTKSKMFILLAYLEHDM